MKYRKESFFNKYNIEPNIEPGKLLNIFQTNPKKRKDLPNVISIIKDKNKLFEEELFTLRNAKNLTSELLIKHYNLLIVLKNINVLKLESLRQFEKVYIEFRKCQYNEFFYNKEFDEEKNKKIIEEFIYTILEELLNNIIDNLEKINNNTIIWISKFFELNNKDLSYKLEDIIASRIEVTLSKINDIEYLKENLDFICNLPEEFLKKDTIYKSYLYFVEKTFISYEDIDFINENYIKIFKILKKEDADKNSKILNKIGIIYTNIYDTKYVSYSKFKKNIEILINNYLYFNYNIKTDDSKFDKEEFNISIEILNILYELGEINYDSFYKCLNNITKTNNQYLKEYIYDFVEFIITNGFPKTTYEAFANLLIERTPFDEDITLWGVNREKYYGFIELNRNVTDIIMYNDEILSVIKSKGCTINEISKIDDILSRYYPIHYLCPNAFPEKLINALKESVFDGLALMETANEYKMRQPINIYGYGTSLTYNGSFMVNFLKECPSDWMIENQSVKDFLKYKLNESGVTNYGESKFNTYKNKYDNLFNNKEDYYNSRKTFILTKIDSISKPETIYKKAIQLFDEKKFDKSIILFDKIYGYKDSIQYIDVAINWLKETKYQEAITLYNERKYQEAIDKFIEIKEYKNSSEFIDVSEIQIKEPIYQQAIELFKNRKFEEALDIFSKIKEYKNVIEFIDTCNEWIKETKYQEAITLYNERKYQEAIDKFIEIKEYKNSSEFIGVSEIQIKESIYQQAIELFKNRKFEEALDIFSKIKEYKNVIEFIDTCNEWIKETKYQEAISLYKEEKYQQAKKLFKEIKGYKDSSELLEQTKIVERTNTTYKQAIKLFDDKQYSKAKTEFQSVSKYKDSEIYIKQCNDRITIKRVIIIIVFLSLIIIFSI